MTFEELDKQKVFRVVFRELEQKVEALRKEQIKLGWQHRNELITHVYSDYNNDEKLLNKKKEWELVGQEQRATLWIYELLKDSKDLYGYFENPEAIIQKLNNLLIESDERELYEISKTLNYWNSRLRSEL